MALDGRRGAPKPAGPPTRQSPAPTSAPPPGGYERDRYLSPTHSQPDRDRQQRDRYPPPARSDSADRDRSRERYPPPVAGAPERERSPLRAEPYDDRYRDPYREPPPPRRDDPYADPYRRAPPPPIDDPYYDRYRDDPYRYPPPPRRDPYADPYRDPYYRDPAYEAPPPVRKPPPPLDCQIVILNQTLMKFAEFVERKLKALQVFCSISLISEDRTIPQVVEDAAKKQCLFAIVINSQNEVHQSLTVNILHGTPQEHRNMPVDDACALIGRSFDAYQLAKREKEAAARAPPAPAARAPPPFVPPSQDILYLLNLLADKRQLTVDELDKVINYLTERRDKLLEAEGRLPPKAYPSSYGGAGEPKPDAQKDLQAKILSILNGPGEGGSGGLSQQPQGNGAVDGRSQAGGMSSLINLDNPNVQKALDNLIQSGPNLLKNLSHSPGNPSAPGAALMSRESQHTQPQPSMGRDPYGVPPPRAQAPGMQMSGGRPQFGGAASAGGQAPRMANPGGMPPRRPPPQY